jgi:hypothetical protein
MFDEERTHTCKTLSHDDMIKRYYSTALFELDEDVVAVRWLRLVFEDPVLLNTPGFVLCQYQCKDYLDVNVKTVEWMEILKEQVLKILRLEDRLHV